MVGEPPDLDGRLADAVERLGDAARAMLRRAASAEGLSPTQAQLLLRITSGSAREGTGALAGWLEVSAPTVSDALRTLVGKGVVERGHPPNRGRGRPRRTVSRSRGGCGTGAAHCSARCTTRRPSGRQKPSPRSSRWSPSSTSMATSAPPGTA